MLSVLTINACALDPIPLPDFEEAERLDVEVTDPVGLPMLCEIPFTTAECFLRLDVYEDAAENNTEIAQLNADIARDSDVAYDHILSAAKQQQTIAIIREEMLVAERRAHLIDNVERGLLVLILTIALVL